MNEATVKHHQKLERRYADIEDLRRAAKRRLPGFADDYLSSGIGPQVCLEANRRCLDGVKLIPHNVVDPFTPDLTTRLFGHDWSAPYGIAPLGLSGLIWPDAACHFARTAADRNIPVALSTVATTSLEKIAEIAPQAAWFQLYIPNDEEITASLVKRAGDAGYRTLIVTVDVPALGRREKDIRNGLSVPPKISARNIFQAAMCPSWSLATLASGLPDFENLKQYVPEGTGLRGAAGYVSSLARGHVSIDKLNKVRAQWKGNLVVKGILSAEDAKLAKQAGCDAIVVSNHGGRQLDAAPCPLKQVAVVREAVGGSMPILADSGVRSGLDIARMLAAGADFVLLGRAFAWGVAALGAKGPDHVDYILRSQLQNVLSQVGCPTPDELVNTAPQSR